MPSDGLPKNLEPLEAGDPASIGPYMLAGRLGSGGMGTVYLGRTPDSDALVAIKVIRPELAFDEATRARFRDEMEHARRVASFCTAKILDHGTFENRPYMVTEYIAGTALAEHIANHGKLDSSTLHGFALGVAAALHAIHGAGLVHRDLKPANVLLSLSGPRVIDFGIARALNTTTNHTRTGIVMGSPGWMAPEQLLEEPVTTAADIFAWGCLVAFAGTGSHPFGNGDAMTLGKRVLFAEPQLGQLDNPLDRLVRAALEKKPERRPKAQDLLLELAGGGSETVETTDPNAMVSNALNQSWRPPLPPMPHPHGPGPGPGPGPHQTATAMPRPPGPMPGQPGQPGPQQQPGPPQPGPQQPGPQHQQRYGPPGPPPGAPHQAPAAAHAGPPGAAVSHGPLPANQSQPMQRPGHDPGQGYGARPGHQTGQFPTVPPNATGPIPQVPPSQPAAQPYVPPVPPPPHKPASPERRRMRWVVAAVILGAALLLTALGVLLWLAEDELPLPGRSDDSTEEPGDAGDAPGLPGVEEDADDEPLADELGTVIDAGVRFTVYAPECTDDPQGQGSRCVFPVHLVNTSPSRVQLMPEWQELQEQGISNPHSGLPVAGNSDESMWQPLSSEDEGEGTLVFQVRDGEQLEALRLRGSPNSQGTILQISSVTA